MKDIKELENRIKSLEYYTTLSLLEKETANLLITDSDGLNRFKSYHKIVHLKLITQLIGSIMN